MEHRTRRDHKLIHLVSEFEAMSETGNLTYLNEKSFYQLINYYEDEYLIDKALEVVDIAIEQFQYRAEFYITKAKLLLRDQKISKALEIIEIAENISPSENDVIILKARCVGGESGLEMLSPIKAYAGKEELIDIYMCESYIYEKSREYEKMFSSLKQILKLVPLHSIALERVFICVDIVKNFEESIKYHSALIEVNPYNFLAWYNLGHAYACTGEYEKAISAMEYSFIINKDFELAYLDCADICIQIKNYGKALTVFEEANNYFGPDSEILVQIAQCHLSMDNLLSAKANLFSALRLDAYNDEIFFFNANAVVYYQAATEIAPEQEHLWYQLASLLIKLNRIDDAIEVLNNAEIDAVGPELLYCRAVCFTLIGRKKEALVILDEALIDNFEMHNKLFELDPSLKFDKDILSIIHYYEGEPKM